MLHENVVQLRKLNRMTQEQLAERLGVSRQTISKWETGESVPDIMQCQQLAKLFHVSLDSLASYDIGESNLPVPPKGKHIFGLVKVGEKGQIVIPMQARKVFKIQQGDRLILLGDENQGMALIPAADFLNLSSMVSRLKDASEE